MESHNMWPFLSAFCHFFHMMFLKFTHRVAQIGTSSLFMDKYYSLIWINHISFTRSSADGHLGCFCLSVIVNRATMSIRVQGFMWTHVLSSLG